MRRTLDIVALRLASWLVLFGTRHFRNTSKVKAAGRCIERDIVLARQIISNQ